MKLLPGLALTLALVGSAAAQTPAVTPGVPVFDEAGLRTDPQFDAATFQKLQSIQVDVAWNKADLLKALQDLTQITQQADPAHGRIEFQLAASDPSGLQGRRKVSVSLVGVPVFAVLQYLSQQANFQIQVHRDRVLVQTLGQP